MPDTARPTPGGVMGPPPETSSAYRIGQTLSPVRVTHVLLAADAGEMAPLHDALNEGRQKDGLVQSVLGTREQALVGSGWQLIANPCGAEKDSAEWDYAHEINDFCRAAVDGCEDVDRAIAHLQDGVYKPYSVVEIIWRLDGETLLPARLECKGGRRFAFSTKQELCWYEPDVAGHAFPGVPLLETFPNRFIVHQPRVNGDEPHREGLGRLLLWYICFRLWGWRDRLLFSELYGKPWRDVTYSDDAGPEEVELAGRIAAQASSKTGIWHPESITIDVKWPEAAGGAQSSPGPLLISDAGAEIALAVLGQLGTTGDVQNGLGGAGDAREKVRRDILRNDERDVSATLRKHLLTPLVLFRFGEEALRYLPRWSFNVEDAIDLEKTLAAMSSGVALGMRIPVAYAHDVTGFPSAQEGEDVLAAPAQPVVVSVAEPEAGKAADE